MKTTKNEILNTALSVFSQKGYEGALLRDISDSLGITKAALYKHFKSKEALWNTLIDYVEQYYSEHINSLSNIPIPDNWDKLKEISLKQIEFTLHDETVKRVRKLLTIEQYRNERMSALATKHFITDIESRFTKAFEKMIEKGVLKYTNPELLAFQYTAPITMLIHLCDRESEKEAEIMKKIEAHIEQFTREYKTT
ncbi:MAG: TetR/AcrR family transcriptional regulator [Ruminococcus sp.]